MILLHNQPFYENGSFIGTKNHLNLLTKENIIFMKETFVLEHSKSLNLIPLAILNYINVQKNRQSKFIL